MVNAQEAYRLLCGQLRQAGIETPGFEVEQMFRKAVGCSRLQADRLTAAQWEDLGRMAALRATRYPLQYILGSWSFLDLELEVGPGVLVPRPETEEVCYAAANLVKMADCPVILDLCAGSGALALGLQSLLPQAEVTAVEKYPEAYRYLEQNTHNFMQAHGRSPRLVLGDAHNYYQNLEDGSLDLLVSNPPYISEAEYAGLEPELMAEPRQALLAEEEGLAFYRSIAGSYASKLKLGGWLVFEIGYRQGSAVCEIMTDSGLSHVTILKDMNGNERIATGMRDT